jgi:hypothetical protein
LTWDRELPRIVELEKRRVIRQERHVPERRRESVDDSSHEQRRVANSDWSAQWDSLRQYVASDVRSGYEADAEGASREQS